MANENVFRARKSRNDKKMQWEELLELSATVREFIKTPALIVTFVHDSEQVSKLDTQQRNFLTNLMRMLSTDTDAFKAELDAIDARASTMHGRVSELDILNFFNFATEYQDWLYRYQSVMFPNIVAVAKLFGQEQLISNMLYGEVQPRMQSAFPQTGGL